MAVETTRLFQIFRAGTHTAMSGQPLTFSEADLRLTATAYLWQKDRCPAPLVIGHPADNEPAYGEVNGLISRGDKLFAYANVSNGLINAVKTGYYKKVSAAFYSPNSPGNPIPGVWSLRHIGFLGAQPPAVKGMEPLSFTEGGTSVEFCELSAGNMGRDRKSIHSAALRLHRKHPEFSYIDAVRILEKY